MKRDEVLWILAEHWEELRGFEVRELAVFGSVVRDEAVSGSDVDLLVEFEPEAQVGLFEFVDLKHYLEEILGCPVDLVTPDGLKHGLRERILGEAITAG